MKRTLGVAVCCILSVAAYIGIAEAERDVTSDDRRSLGLTVYTSELALVRDKREVVLSSGEQTFVFKDISAKILPETVLASGAGVEIIEQNYAFDLLSPESLLQKYVGREVTLVRTNEKNGQKSRLAATVLSTAGGVVLQVGDHIETGIHGRILFPSVPDTLRHEPTLSMTVLSEEEGAREMQLAYLGEGVSWKADYIALLNSDENRVEFTGLVTLTNNSGTDFPDATLQLVAGEVNRVRPQRGPQPVAMAGGARSAAARESREMSRESFSAYHLYTLERPATLLDNQTKQIVLFQEKGGKVEKRLLLRSRTPGYFWNKVGEISRGEEVEVLLVMNNDEVANLGSPKPAGTVRVYRRDESERLQFIGEDTIDHTPEDERIEIKLGESFDVTADRIQEDFAHIRGTTKGERTTESEFAITLQNAKKEAVTVTVEEYLPGDWQILSHSHPYTKENATTVSWEVEVQGKGSTTLNYRVRTRMQ